MAAATTADRIMPLFAVRHRTIYRYGAPVTPGFHRLVLRPRDGHDVRLVDAALTIEPEPAAIRWLYDVYDNPIAMLEFAGETTTLVIESRLLIDHYGFAKPALPVEPFARSWPFMYRPEEWIDLEIWTRRQWSDPEGRLDRWVRELTRNRLELPTQDLLVSVMHRIKTTLGYQVRSEEGIQAPLKTLADGGSCRDFAVLMIEALRCLGFAARFVSGYIHAPQVDETGAAILGGGATHAWVQVYLPGAGWVEFDPTNAIYGGADLVRVAIARDPTAVSSVSGSFTGPRDVVATLEVDVVVDRYDQPLQSLVELDELGPRAEPDQTPAASAKASSVGNR